jgi:GT2 family glycosyltransferase
MESLIATPPSRGRDERDPGIESTGHEALALESEEKLALCTSRAAPGSRPRASGKFLFAGDEKLYVRGVTYGTFRPDAKGWHLPAPELVERDLDEMARNGVNAVRLYCVPPQRVLDQVWLRGLRVVVGIPWEQHVAFLDDPKRVRSIEARVRAGVAACAGHPALLCFLIGNEIPSSIVRWTGWRRVERHLRRLYEAAKSEDPGALVSYANYPSTEYLDLPFLDVVCFNVYLQQTGSLADYVARLQNLAGDRPLILSELGHDSRRNGKHHQARSLHEQVSATFASGCAGAFVFAWTDEWHRGGHDVDDWDFGLTARDRTPKPALSEVRRAFEGAPFPLEQAWPRVSVVVCVYDGEETLDDCLTGLERLAYPDVELLVVDDGSTDRSAEIAARHACRLVRTENRGLSCARNTGLAEATGEIVAYIDADARPDPHWLHYLVETLRDGAFVGAGGPNLPCPGDGEFAACVGRSPGGPTHVLLSDHEAEHIPGCNMAFRKGALEAIGGFDPQFRVAGDDVDVCWRLQERGWKLGFAPSAVVWHHQRRSLRAYWRQQRGYGRAEALLERKWPEKYNAAGQVAWSGRIYAAPLLYTLSWASRVYQGTWGLAPYQHRHARPDLFTTLAGAPEWNLVLVSLLGLVLLGLAWPPLASAATPLLLAACGVTLWRAGRGAALPCFSDPPARSRWTTARRRARVALLFLVQPAARLVGRIASGLTPWRVRRGSSAIRWLPWPRRMGVWSESWREPMERLRSIESRLRRERAVVVRGGPYDRWDLEVREGWGAVRLRMCVEDHGEGRQLVRIRLWPWSHAARLGWTLAAGASAFAAAAALDGAWLAAGVLVLAAGGLCSRIARQSAAALGLAVEALRAEHRRDIDLGAAPELPALPMQVRTRAASSEGAS